MGIFYRSLSILIKDKSILCLSCVPVLMGSVLYFFLGAKLYQLVSVQGRAFVHDLLGESSGANLAYGLLFILFMTIIIFLVNWTFVIVVSILASPFNDIMSTLVERRYTGIAQKAGTPEKFSLLKFLRHTAHTIWNECKKVSLIAVLTLLACAISLIPPLAIVGSIATALLLAIQFIDYSWARHQWRVRQCARDSFKHFFSYTLGGIVFMFFMSHSPGQPAGHARGRDLFHPALGP